MKKSFLFAAISLTTLALAASCSKKTTPVDPGTVTGEEGYKANGVEWAYTNVGTPGTFMKFSWQYGYYYQFNSRIGWAPTESGPVSAPAGATWNSSYTVTEDWTAENDPCPEGWRLPTVAEIQSLGALNASQGKIKDDAGNDVPGIVFTLPGSPQPSLFFPLSNYLVGGTGALGNSPAVASGEYWSSTQGGDQGGYSMGLVARISDSKLGDTSPYASGLTIRCVKGKHS